VLLISERKKALGCFFQSEKEKEFKKGHNNCDEKHTNRRLVRHIMKYNEVED